MKIKMGFAIIPIACLAMGACKFGGGDDKKAPTGQVVATVNGEAAHDRLVAGLLELLL